MICHLDLSWFESRFGVDKIMSQHIALTNHDKSTIGTSPQLRKESQFNSSWWFLFRLRQQSEAWTCGQDLEATGQQMVGQTGGDQGTQPMALGRSCDPARKGAKRKKTRYLQWHSQLGSRRGRRHQASGGEQQLVQDNLIRIQAALFKEHWNIQVWSKAMKFESNKQEWWTFEKGPNQQGWAGSNKKT